MGTPLWLERIARLFFPPRCAGCGRVVPGGAVFCPECERGLLRVEKPVCPRCGRGRAWCTCGGRHPNFERLVAPFYYEGAARRGILRMKYAGHPEAAPGLAADVCAAVTREYEGIPFDCVTAVPMGAAEKRARGFNQSERLGRQIARRLSLPYRETLRKAKATRPQHRCTAAERRRNVVGAYEGLPGAPGRAILLVDDVVTTGATLDECAGVLRHAGAERVYGAAVACVRRRGGPDGKKGEISR